MAPASCERSSTTNVSPALSTRVSRSSRADDARRYLFPSSSTTSSTSASFLLRLRGLAAGFPVLSENLLHRSLEPDDSLPGVLAAAHQQVEVPAEPGVHLLPRRVVWHRAPVTDRADERSLVEPWRLRH